MRMSKLLAVGLGILISTVSAQETVKIGTSADYEPWTFLQGEKVVGYDIDVVNEICQVQSLDCEISVQSWKTLINSLRFKKYHALAAGIYDTDARERKLIFSEPYALVQAQFIVNKSGKLAKTCQKGCANVISLNELSGAHKKTLADLQENVKPAVLAVQEKSAHLAALQEMFPEANLKEFKNVEAAMAALEKKEADALFTGALQAQALIEKHGAEALSTMPVKFEGGKLGKGVAIGFRVEEEQLKDAFNEGLQKIKDNGKLKELSNKWFGLDISPK